MSRQVEDDALMDEVRAAVAQTDAVPPHRRDAARAAFAWRSIDDELMTLAEDSALAGLAVRGSAGGRVLTFHGHGVTVEVEVDGGQVMGQVLATPDCRVALETAAGGSTQTYTDQSGFFSLAAGDGPARFAVEIDGETRRTEWIVL